MSDPSIFDDIDTIEGDETVIGSLERDDGTYVVLQMTAHENEEDARAFMDALEAAYDMDGVKLH